MPAPEKDHKAARRRAGFFILWLGVFSLGNPFFNSRPSMAVSVESSESSISHPVESAAPLSLNQVVDIALRQNPGLAAQRNALSSSELSLASARSDFQIQISPTGTVGISVEDNQELSYYSTGISVSKKFATGSQVALTPMIGWEEEDGSTRLNSMEVELTQPLFQGISPEFNRSAVRGAELNVRSARRRYFLAQVDVFLQTVSGFYDILLRKNLLETSRQSVEQLEAFARTAEIKRKIGLAAPEDVFRSNQRLQQAMDDLVTREQALQSAEDTLKRLLDWPVSEPIHIDGELTVSPVYPDETEAVASALENRVEIDEAEDLLRETNNRSRDARHRLLPKLDLSLAYTTYDLDSSLFEDPALNESRWGISLSTSSDIFRRTEKTEYKQSLLAVEDTERNLSTLRNDIVRQVRESIRNLSRFAASIELQETRAREAEKQLSLSRFKFKYGMSNNFDLLDAESVLSAARGNVDTAKVQYIVGIYRLRAAMGTLLSNPDHNP